MDEKISSSVNFLMEEYLVVSHSSNSLIVEDELQADCKTASEKEKQSD